MCQLHLDHIDHLEVTTHLRLDAQFEAITAFFRAAPDLLTTIQASARRPRPPSSPRSAPTLWGIAHQSDFSRACRDGSCPLGHSYPILYPK